MDRPPPRRALLIVVAASGLSLMPSGCSDRPEPAASTQVGDFRVVKFAGEKVVISFRDDLPTEAVPESGDGQIAKAGDRVVLSDAGEGEIFLAKDLDALKFYHATPGPDQLDRFRRLGDEGRLFVVARGTAGVVHRVVEGELPQGLKAVELKLGGDQGGMAWVADPFVRRLEPGSK